MGASSSQYFVANKVQSDHSRAVLISVKIAFDRLLHVDSQFLNCFGFSVNAKAQSRSGESAGALVFLDFENDFGQGRILSRVLVIRKSWAGSLGYRKQPIAVGVVLVESVVAVYYQRLTNPWKSFEFQDRVGPRIAPLRRGRPILAHSLQP